MTLDLPSPTATTDLAHRLAPHLGAGDVLLLEGHIGAGKSHFARSLIQHLLPVPEDVPSPTFTLVQCYQTPGFDIWHCDLYRLTHPDEALELGLDDAFEQALCLIEWPDRLAGNAPDTALTLRFEATGEFSRRVTLSASDPKWRHCLEITNA